MKPPTSLIALILTTSLAPSQSSSIGVAPNGDDQSIVSTPAPSAYNVPAGWALKDSAGNSVYHTGKKGTIKIEYDNSSGPKRTINIDHKNKIIEIGNGTFNAVKGNADQGTVRYGGLNTFLTNPIGGKWIIGGNDSYYLEIDDGGDYTIDGERFSVYIDGGDAKNFKLTLNGSNGIVYNTAGGAGRGTITSSGKNNVIKPGLPPRKP